MIEIIAQGQTQYEPSDASLVRQIPQNWERIRVKDITERIGNGVTPKGGSEVYTDSGTPFLRSQNIYDGGLRLYNVSFIPESIHKEMQSSQLKPNDILINITGASIGRTCLVPKELGDANINQHIALVRLKKRCDTNYVAWFLKSSFLKEHIKVEQAGASKEALNLSQIAEMPIFLPNAGERRIIISYLETKVARIDRKIELLRQKALKYGELKQSLINETVTRGLDKSVPMKDSGIAWAETVPIHWNIERMKDEIQERSQKGFPEEPLLIASQSQGVTLKSEYDRHTMTAQKNFESLKLVEVDDFVISLRSFEGGIEIAYNRGIISSAYTVIHPTSIAKTGYFKYLFKAKGFISMLVTCTTGIREGRNINYQQLKREFIPVPPNSECQMIADYLDAKTAHIDKIVATLRTQVDKLTELRKTLINDVVTGKIKVADV